MKAIFSRSFSLGSAVSYGTSVMKPKPNFLCKAYQHIPGTKRYEFGYSDNIVGKTPNRLGLVLFDILAAHRWRPLVCQSVAFVGKGIDS